MVSVPTGNELIVKIALPPAIFATPRVVPPEVNVTCCPSGKDPLLVRVAMSLTGWPDLEGLGDEASPIPICAGFTVWSTVVVLVALSGSPS